MRVHGVDELDRIVGARGFLDGFVGLENSRRIGGVASPGMTDGLLWTDPRRWSKAVMPLSAERRPNYSSTKAATGLAIVYR